MNAANPAFLRLVADSLRYWISVMHVDGFRFDLASVLARGSGNLIKTSSLFEAVSQDPLLNRVKLIAEPWDLKAYEVGNFPVDWSEWNGKFRDTIRKFAKGDAVEIAELAKRLFGSSDIYRRDGRSSFNSINFITCHDGFTLNDLVSYDRKHNEANGEDNRDGADDNNSSNCGAEGETGDPQIKYLRKQLMKNFICCLLFARGTPMILGGDEFCRSQKGNNNAYCQDNELSWFNWGLLEENKDIYEFFRKAIRTFKNYRAFRKRYIGYGNFDPPGIRWFDKNLGDLDWHSLQVRTLCVQLEDKIKGMPEFSILHILNADREKQWIRLPKLSGKLKWHRLIDTSLDFPQDFLDPQKAVVIEPDDCYIVNPRSYVYLFTADPTPGSTKAPFLQPY
jgi:glycogen operon protein